MNFATIEASICEEGSAAKVFQELSLILQCLPKSLKTAYERRKEKLAISGQLDYYQHGNQLLDSGHEALLIGYLLLLSEMGLQQK